MFGYPEQELVEKPFLPFVCEADRAWLIDLHQRRMKGLKVESPYVIGVQRGDERCISGNSTPAPSNGKVSWRPGKH